MDEERVKKVDSSFNSLNYRLTCTMTRLESKSEVDTMLAGESSFYSSNKNLKLNNNRISEKPYKCEKCQSVFGYENTFLRHVSLHNGEKPYKCGQCNSFFRYDSSLSRHLETHTVEKRYKCGQCKFTFIDKSSLTRHLKTHSGERGYKCGQCTFLCNHKSNFTRHLRTHMGEKGYECDQCKYVSNEKRKFIRHVKTHTAQKRYKCEQCRYVCDNNRSLIRHIRTHTGEKPFKCGQCTYLCNEKSNLKRHERSKHSKTNLCSDEKEYKCAQCNTAFTEKSALNEHERTHAVENPFKCTLCDYACNETNKLIIHVRKHHRHKPYNCEQCNYVCTRKCDLITHEKQHIKLYTCSQCAYACNSRTSLIIHERTHAIVQLYKCIICDQLFNKYTLLEEHQKSKHATNFVLRSDSQQTFKPNMELLKRPKLPCYTPKDSKLRKTSVYLIKFSRNNSHLQTDNIPANGSCNVDQLSLRDNDVLQNTDIDTQDGDDVKSEIEGQSQSKNKALVESTRNSSYLISYEDRPYSFVKEENFQIEKVKSEDLSERCEGKRALAQDYLHATNHLVAPIRTIKKATSSLVKRENSSRDSEETDISNTGKTADSEHIIQSVLNNIKVETF